MAKNIKSNENQMDLFSVPADNESTLKTVEPTLEKVVAVETPVIKTPVAEVVVPEVIDSVSSNNAIKDFLQAKEVTVESEETIVLEISGQLKFSREGFVNSIPVESRFVSLSLADDNVVIVTPYQEDGSLTLKSMKESFPGFVTQLQKVNENTFIDSVDNMALLDRLENIIEGKKIAVMKEGIDIKQIDAEISFIDKLESGEAEILDDESQEVEVARPEPKKVKAKI